MVDLNKRKADRLRVMNEFFEAASGSEQAFIDTEAVRTKLGLSDQEMADACNYLTVVCWGGVGCGVSMSARHQE